MHSKMFARKFTFFQNDYQLLNSRVWAISKKIIVKPSCLLVQCEKFAQLGEFQWQWSIAFSQ